jgi:HSP20 family protein
LNASPNAEASARGLTAASVRTNSAADLPALVKKRAFGLLDMRRAVITFFQQQGAKRGCSMSLARWDPFQDIASLQDRINRLFEDAFPKPQKGDSSGDADTASWRPAVDIYETDTTLVVTAELPGVRKEDVSVEVKNNVLTIQGQRIQQDEVKEEHYVRRERLFGTFSRSFNLRYHVNPESIRARFKEGILQVEISKPEQETAKQITVNVE